MPTEYSCMCTMNIHSKCVNYVAAEILSTIVGHLNAPLILLHSNHNQVNVLHCEFWSAFRHLTLSSLFERL